MQTNIVGSVTSDLPLILLGFTNIDSVEVLQDSCPNLKAVGFDVSDTGQLKLTHEEILASVTEQLEHVKVALTAASRSSPIKWPSYIAAQQHGLFSTMITGEKHWFEVTAVSIEEVGTQRRHFAMTAATHVAITSVDSELPQPTENLPRSSSLENVQTVWKSLYLQLTT